MRNPLAFVGAAPDGPSADPHRLGEEPQRLPSQFPLASLLTADTRAPPTHRGAGLGGGAANPYTSASSRVSGSGGDSSKRSAVVVAPPSNSSPFMNRSEDWVQQSRKDSRASKEDSAFKIATVAVIGGALVVIAIALL